jgi:curved DNA-binding protein CbpA
MGFDPYESWLGIPADLRPPTYYQLLGLEPFESDPATIDQAALRRMARVRQHQLGPHSDQSQEILAELARARLILIDADRRADYDARLQDRRMSRPGPSSDPEAVEPDRTTGGRPEPQQAPPDVLGSLVLSEGGRDRLLSPRRASKGGSRRWKRGLVFGAFVSTHVAIFAAFLIYVLPWISGRNAAHSVRNDPHPSSATGQPKPPPAQSAERAAPKPQPAQSPSLAASKPQPARNPKLGAPKTPPARQSKPPDGNPAASPIELTHLRVHPLDEKAVPKYAAPGGTEAPVPAPRKISPEQVKAREELEKARKGYDQANEKVGRDLINVFDRVIRQVNGNKNMPSADRVGLVAQLEREKRDFKVDGFLPRSEDMIIPVVQCKRNIWRERATLLAAYNHLIDICERDGDADEALRLADEVKSFKSERWRDARLDLFGVWAGTRELVGQPQSAKFSMSVVERKGKNFRGRVEWLNGLHIGFVQGVFDGFNIEFKTVGEMEKGLEHVWEFKGFVHDNLLDAEFRGTNRNAEGEWYPVQGKIYLKLSR